jgi:endonuclease/exonuclease/phosphatase (EEP) superfamily protein YafD
MISCRPYYLPREFSSTVQHIFCLFTLPPQTDAGTKTALKELNRAIIKQDNANPEVTLLFAGDFNTRQLKSDLPQFYHHVTYATHFQITFTPNTETHTRLALLWQI